jgi:thiol-disulfide isomerase/thioredoxin
MRASVHEGSSTKEGLMYRFVVLAALLTGAICLPAGAQAPAPQKLTLAVGDARPTLDFTFLDGARAPTWDDLKGKVVVVDFWATWCAPCIAAFPKLNELERAFRGRDVVFLSVSYEPARWVRDFLAKHPLETRVATDNDFATFKAFNAWGIPAVYVFDGSGRIVAVVHPTKLDATVIDAALGGRIPAVVQAQPWSDPKGAEEYFRKTRAEQEEKLSKQPSTADH